jgi:hypothetical protein
MFDGRYYRFNTQDPEFREHLMDMQELQKQYFNNEISFEEFEQRMSSEEFHQEDFGCHGALGMMGPYMMGWR